MLETWLLTDVRAMECYLSTEEHPVLLKSIPGFSNNRDHKRVMIDVCKKRGRGKRANYNDVTDAVKIARCIPKEPDDLKQLKRKSESFRILAKGLRDALS